MKHKKSLSLWLLLALVLTLSCISLPALADVVEVSSAANIDSALSGGNDIKLVADITFDMNNYAMIDSSNLNIYLNGHTLKFTNTNSYFYFFGSSLHIYGGASATDTTQSGKIDSISSDNYPIFVNDVGVSSELYIHGGTIQNVHCDRSNITISGGNIINLNFDEKTLNISGGMFKDLSIGNYCTASLTGGYYNKIYNVQHLAANYGFAPNTDEATKTEYPYKVAPAKSLTGSATGSDSGSVSFKAYNYTVTCAAPGAPVTATAASVEGYTVTLTASENVTDFNASTGTFTMPEGDVTITANYVPVKTITNGTPQTDATTNHGYIVLSAESAAENAEITVTAYPEDGYMLKSLTYTPTDGGDASTITGSSFTMPAYAVTVNATFIQTSGKDIDLDLEESTDDIPDKTTIDQYYQKTTGTETVTNYKVQVTWTAQTLQINVADAYVWNPTDLTWKMDTASSGTATLVENSNVRTYTFINYSPEALTCSVTFAAAEGLADKYTSFSAENATLGAVEVDEDGKALDKYFTGNTINTSALPSASITCTITPNLGEGGFQGAAAVTEATLYGTYTINVDKD